MECLGMAACGTALYAADARHREKSLGREPVLAALAAIGLHQDLDLLLHHIRVQWQVDVRRSQTAIPFYNFVFQDQVVAGRAPDHLIDQSVVLVRVIPLIAEDDIWVEARAPRADESLQ